MARLRPLLASLLALLLLVQSGVALAHCLRGMAPGEGLLVEICAAEGKRLVLLGPDGAPTEAPEPGAGPGFCPVCHGLPGAAVPAPAVAPAPPVLRGQAPWHAAGVAFLPPPTRAPPYATRAPPVLA